MTRTSTVDFNHFYKMSEPFATRPLRFTFIGDDVRLRNDEVTKITRGWKKTEKPFKLIAEMGKQITDFFWTDYVGVYCVSLRVIELLEKNQITGWTTYPVELWGKNQERIPDYFGFAVTGKECRRDMTKGRIIQLAPFFPGAKPRAVYLGAYFVESDWDGSDFFWVNNFVNEVVTKRVRDLFVKNHVTNVKLVSLTQVTLETMLDRYIK